MRRLPSGGVVMTGAVRGTVGTTVGVGVGSSATEVAVRGTVGSGRTEVGVDRGVAVASPVAVAVGRTVGSGRTGAGVDRGVAVAKSVAVAVGVGTGGVAVATALGERRTVGVTPAMSPPSGPVAA